MEFADSLCSRLHTDVYCTTAKNFHRYITAPAKLDAAGTGHGHQGPGHQRALLGGQALGGADRDHAGRQDVAEQDGHVPPRQGSFTWKPGATGTYDVSLAAKELRTGKGLRTRTTGTVESQ